MTTREFRLSQPGSKRGLSCDEYGAFVGAIALLERSPKHGNDHWRPRDCGDLFKQLGSHFSLPIDMSSKTGRLKAIANALNEGDLARAQIATVLLGIPDPPEISKGTRSRDSMIKFIRDLHWSGLIKWDGKNSGRSSELNFDPGTSAPQPDGSGLIKAGFNPDEPRDERGWWTDGGDVYLIPAQAVIAEPLVEPLFGEMVRPFPGTIDVVPPMTVPRAQNPYPDRPECEEEWAAAKKFCDDLKRRGKLGKNGYRGFGKTYQQCLLGQVSEACGGNPVA